VNKDNIRVGDSVRIGYEGKRYGARVMKILGRKVTVKINEGPHAGKEIVVNADE
jgi:hypothetical protein